jgi:hypothetical protein
VLFGLTDFYGLAGAEQPRAGACVWQSAFAVLPRDKRSKGKDEMLTEVINPLQHWLVARVRR